MIFCAGRSRYVYPWHTVWCTCTFPHLWQLLNYLDHTFSSHWPSDSERRRYAIIGKWRQKWRPSAGSCWCSGRWGSILVDLETLWHIKQECKAVMACVCCHAERVPCSSRALAGGGGDAGCRRVTADPVEHTNRMEISTELAWEMSRRVLRTAAQLQRTPIKLVVRDGVTYYSQGLTSVTLLWLGPAIVYKCSIIFICNCFICTSRMYE